MFKQQILWERVDKEEAQHNLLITQDRYKRKRSKWSDSSNRPMHRKKKYGIIFAKSAVMSAITR